MADYVQTGRLLRIKTPLGDNKVLLLDIDGSEGISRPFLFQLTLGTEETANSMQSLLGKDVTFWLGAVGVEPERPLHGRIRRLSQHHDSEHDTDVWRAEVVPAFWFLSRKIDSRIFQDMTVLQVIKRVLDDNGVTFYEDSTTKTYEKMTYCVQYKETTFNFLSRIMEENGIFYWHQFDDSSHTFHFSDLNSKTPMLDPSNIYYGDFSAPNKMEWFGRDFDFRSGKISLRDYNFESSTSRNAYTETARVGPTQMTDHEVFDYPARVYDFSGGSATQRASAVARIRIEEEEARYDVLSGGTDIRAMRAGCRVNIFGLEPNSTASEAFLVTEVRHHGQDKTFWVSDAATARYRNEFSAIRNATPYRPVRNAQRPIVLGPQTATVTGPAGSEIHTDALGQVKIRFHWDRNPFSNADESSSCWVRVSQAWAGAGWGSMHIPRVDQEVIVEFLEGDPDRPIITGRVYNKTNMPPWTLPANKTQSGIKSNSSLGGGGSNEFRFEDKKGAEEVYFHAEKDLNSVIENNETRLVGGKGTGDRTTTIKHDDWLKVQNNLKTDVTVNKTTTVGGNFTETITGNETRTVSGAVSETVTGNYTTTINGRLNMTVALGVGITTPLDVTVTSSTGVTVIAPTKTTVAPSWFKSGAASGDAYGFKMGIAGMKMDMVGFALGLIILKMDFAAFKFDTFGIAVKTGGIELKNASLKAGTYAFKGRAGFSVKM